MPGREKEHIVKDVIRERESARSSLSLPAIDWNITNYWGC